MRSPNSTPHQFGAYQFGASQFGALSVAAKALAALLLLQGCGSVATDGLKPGSGHPLELRESTPAAGATDVALNAVFKLKLSAAPDPETLRIADILIASGPQVLDGTLEVDLVAETLTFTPGQLLRPNVRYQLLITPPLVGLDGSKLEEQIRLSVETGDRVDPPPSPPAPVTTAEVQTIFSRRCLPCHGGEYPDADVNLSTAAASRAALVNIVSRDLELLRVAPGDHAQSYLVRKLLGNYGFVGLPMPPETPLPQDEIETIVRWIDLGAPN